MEVTPTLLAIVRKARSRVFNVHPWWTDGRYGYGALWQWGFGPEISRCMSGREHELLGPSGHCVQVNNRTMHPNEACSSRPWPSPSAPLCPSSNPFPLSSFSLLLVCLHSSTPLCFLQASMEIAYSRASYRPPMHSTRLVGFKAILGVSFLFPHGMFSVLGVDMDGPGAGEVTRVRGSELTVTGANVQWSSFLTPHFCHPNGVMDDPSCVPDLLVTSQPMLISDH